MSTTAPPRADDDLRPSRRTPRLNLPVPGDAGPADYVSATGALADAVDASPSLFTPGDIKLSAALNPPGGWLRCDGAAVLRNTFPGLFAAIGVGYGDGDGETTFNVPDLRGRMPVGGGAGAGLSNRALGQRAGAEAHVLTVAEIAHHNHPVSDPGHAHGVADPGHAHGSYGRADWMGGAGGQWYEGPGWGLPGGVTGPSGVGVGIYGAVTGIYIVGEGGSGAHNNMPPFGVVNFFIKT